MQRPQQGEAVTRPRHSCLALALRSECPPSAGALSRGWRGSCAPARPARSLPDTSGRHFWLLLRPTPGPQPGESVPWGQQSSRTPAGWNILVSRAEDEAAGCVPLPFQGCMDRARCPLPSFPGGRRECAGWREGAQPPPFFSGPGTGLTSHSLQGPTGASSSRRASGKGLFGLG